MAIFVDENTKVVYQGLTGSPGPLLRPAQPDYGTQVVAGTNPKKAGTDVDGIPVFATVAEAVAATGATASCIFIPAPGVKDAVMEAAEGGVEFIVAITEGVPAHDEAWFFNKLKRDFPDVQLLGPNCPGIISPGKCNIGITAGHIAKAPVEGEPNVGIVSRSGTLTYQALYELKLNDIGVTTCVGIGGDPVPGTSFIDCLEAFEADPETKAVMMIGEIGGSAEEEAAEFIADKMTKPVVSYIAGVTAPPGKKMGHAGAIVSGGKGTAAAKQEALAGRRREGRARTPPRPASSWSRSSRASSGMRAPRTRACSSLAVRCARVAVAVLVVATTRRAPTSTHHHLHVVHRPTTHDRAPRPPRTPPRGLAGGPADGGPGAVVTPDRRRAGRAAATWATGAFVVRAPCGGEVTVAGTPLAGATVVLDPGHGGEETGRRRARPGTRRRT